LGKLDEIFPDKVRKVGAEEPKDELEEELKRMDKELVQRARRARLKEYLVESELNVARKERELEKLKNASGGEGEVLSGVSPVMAAELAKLPEDQRKQVIQTYAMLKAAEKTSGNATALLLPLLVGFVKANPQASQVDLVKFAEVMTEQIKTGMQLAKEGEKGKEKEKASWSPVELIKTFGEMIRENVQKPMEELVQRVQPSPSPFERILMDDKLFERAKNLGMFGGPVQQQPQSVTPELKRLDLEIEKIKQDTALKLKEMELQQQRWLAEQQIELQKWEQVGKLFQGPVGKTLQMLGGGVARKISGYSGQQPSVTQLTCPKCGKQFPVFADADRAICPYCGVVLAKTGGEETAQKQEESQQEQREQ